MTSAEDRVARGAALLDRHIPDWRARIDLDHLDIANGAYCILGQLYTERYLAGGEQEYNAYSLGLVDLANMAGIAAVSDELGYIKNEGTFDTDNGFMEWDDAPEYDEYDDNEALTAAWRAELAKC